MLAQAVKVVNTLSLHLWDRTMSPIEVGLPSYLFSALRQGPDSHRSRSTAQGPLRHRSRRPKPELLAAFAPESEEGTPLLEAARPHEEVERERASSTGKSTVLLCM